MFKKYPKVIRLGHEDTDGILSGTFHIQEKIDGANTSIWIEDGEIKNGTPIKVKIETKDFTDVPVEDCIKNDLKRDRSVGKDVIAGMYNKFLKEPVEKVPYNKKLPDCIICDIDGTISHMTSRTPYEYDKVGSDECDMTIRDILDTYSFSGRYEGVDTFSKFDCPIILLVSGRDGGCRPQTEQWMKDNKVRYDELYMRQEGDTRKDVIVKTEIYNEHIKDKYNVLFVLDDRNQTVAGWRALGLKCLQVQEGNF